MNTPDLSLYYQIPYVSGGRKKGPLLLLHSEVQAWFSYFDGGTEIGEPEVHKIHQCNHHLSFIISEFEVRKGNL